MSKILVVGAEPSLGELIQPALACEGYRLKQVGNGPDGLRLLVKEPFDLVIVDLNLPGLNGVEFLRRLRQAQPDLKCLMLTGQVTAETLLDALQARICGWLTRPFTISALRLAVQEALEACPAAGIEVVSARPEWIELRIPCAFSMVAPLQQLLVLWEADLLDETREALTYAFREMLNNALEHGCKLDPAQHIEISLVRLKRVVICRIKDPGTGFDPRQLAHAAICNPDDDPLRHIYMRERQGARAGGFGILSTRQLVDDLIYNEQHNELLFTKYLP